MRYAQSLVLSFMLLFTSNSLADTCYVYTAEELHAALADYNRCTNIIIPAVDGQSNSVVIQVPYMIGQTHYAWFTIGDVHDGLQLTINGTIEWVGGDGCGNCKMLRLNNATNVTISGVGSFISSYTFPSPDNPLKNLPVAIDIVGDCIDVDIDGVSFENVGSMIKQQDGISSGLDFTNLVGTDLWDYGIWLSWSRDVTIENCHVGSSTTVGTQRHHGFRLYGSYIDVLDCSAHTTGAYGLWRVDSWDAVADEAGLIDGFVSNESIRLGPNHACTDGGGPDVGDYPSRTKKLTVLNIDTTANVEVQNGTIGCWLEDITASSISIGNTGSNVVPRPITRIRWTNVSTTPVPVSTPGSGCVGHDVRAATCTGDVDGDGSANVTDLLAVISSWG